MIFAERAGRAWRGAALAVLSLLLAALGHAGEPEPWIATHPLRRTESETLVYQVSSWKGLRIFTMDLGKVTFTLSREDTRRRAGRMQRELVIQGHAVGGAPGYPYVSTLTSRLRDSDYIQVLAKSCRTQPEYRTRLMQWHARGVDVLKHKHCDAPTLCHNPDHLVEGPDGSMVHCRDCENPEHFVWSMRHRHRRIYGHTHDPIAALYLARGLDVEPGGRSRVLRVIQNRDMYDVYFGVEKEEEVTVPAGTIPCYKIKLKFKPMNEHAREHDFEGPFGLHGKIHLWVDKETKQAVLIQGQVKLGAVFDVEVKLIERKAVRSEAPAAPEP